MKLNRTFEASGDSHSNSKPLSIKRMYSRRSSGAPSVVALFFGVKSWAMERLSLRVVLLSSFVIFSVTSILLMSALLMNSASKHNEATLTYASEVIAKGAGMVMSQQFQGLNDLFLRLTDIPFDGNSSAYGLLPPEFTWMGTLDLSHGSVYSDAFSFMTLSGKHDNAIEVESSLFQNHLKLAIDNPGQVVYTGQVNNTIGEPSVFLLRVNSLASRLMIVALSTERIDSFRKNLFLDGGELITIVDASGVVLSRSDFLAGESVHAYRYAQSSTHNLNIPFPQTSIINQLGLGNSGVELSRSNNVLTSYAPISLSPLSAWGVIISQAPDGLEQSNYAISKARFVSIFVGFALAIVFSYFLVKLILRPFDFLAKVANTCSSDTKTGIEQLKSLSCTKNKNGLYFLEVKRLVGAFKKLSDELLVYHERMDAKVVERKLELDLQSKERERVAKQIGYATTHDTLTQLPNLTLLKERINTAVLWSKSTKSGLGLIVIHLHGMEGLQKRYGNIVGDSVLKYAAKYLGSCLDGAPTLARTGANEFTAFILDVEVLEHVMLIVNKLRNLNMSPEMYVDEGVSSSVNVALDISVGFAVSADKTLDVDELFRRARESAGRSSSSLAL